MIRFFEFIRLTALATALASASVFAQSMPDPNNPATTPGGTPVNPYDRGTGGSPGDMNNREPYRDNGRDHSFGWIGLLGLAGLGGLMTRRRPDSRTPYTDTRNTPQA